MRPRKSKQRAFGQQQANNQCQTKINQHENHPNSIWAVHLSSFGQRTAVDNSNPTAANLTVRNQFTTKKISEAENKTKQNRKKKLIERK